jgi:hypothetical protein
LGKSKSIHRKDAEGAKKNHIASKAKNLKPVLPQGAENAEKGYFALKTKASHHKGTKEKLRAFTAESAEHAEKGYFRLKAKAISPHLLFTI